VTGLEGEAKRDHQTASVPKKQVVILQRLFALCRLSQRQVVAMVVTCSSAIGKINTDVKVILGKSCSFSDG